MTTIEPIDEELWAGWIAPALATPGDDQAPEPETEEHADIDDSVEECCF